MYFGLLSEAIGESTYFKSGRWWVQGLSWWVLIKKIGGALEHAPLEVHADF